MLHEAAAATLMRALDHLTDQERRDHEALPADVTAIYASDEEVSALRERVESVREELRADAEAGHFLARLESLAARAVA
jgi:hypothetical protein